MPDPYPITRASETTDRELAWRFQEAVTDYWDASGVGGAERYGLMMRYARLRGRILARMKRWEERDTAYQHALLLYGNARTALLVANDTRKHLAKPYLSLRCGAEMEGGWTCGLRPHGGASGHVAIDRIVHKRETDALRARLAEVEAERDEAVRLKRALAETANETVEIHTSKRDAAEARVAELEAALSESTTLLDYHEWAGSEGDFIDTGVIGRAVCPDCYVVEGTPHADDCELMARLKANRALLTKGDSDV